MKRERRSQQGFALLLTLVLLMIAAVALAHTARQSAKEALDAMEASESLQRRWAVTSCRATLLPRAQGLLMRAARGPVDEEGIPLPGHKPAYRSDLWVSCELAGVPYDLVFTDEQAKYNPSMKGVYAFDQEPVIGERALRRVVSELAQLNQGSASSGVGEVKLRPMMGLDAQGKPVDSDAETQGIYAGYGQLFEGVGPEALLGDALSQGAAANLTCWGDGRLNPLRASDVVLKRALSPLLGIEGVEQLIEAREQMPGMPPERWLDAVVDSTPERRAFVGALLTEFSRAQGLWVVARGRTRSWHTFSVRVYTPPVKQEDTPPPAEADAAQDKPEAEQTPPDPLQRYDFAW